VIPHKVQEEDHHSISNIKLKNVNKALDDERWCYTRI